MVRGTVAVPLLVASVDVLYVELATRLLRAHDREAAMTIARREGETVESYYGGERSPLIGENGERITEHFEGIVECIDLGTGRIRSGTSLFRILVEPVDGGDGQSIRTDEWPSYVIVEDERK